MITCKMTLLPINSSYELDDLDVISDISIIIFATSPICIICCIIILFICSKNIHNIEKNHYL